MDNLPWRLLLHPPNGGVARVVERDESFVLGSNGRGLRMQLTPEQDCREAVFSAKGGGLLLPPLSTVQVFSLQGGAWVALYAGEVRRGGNPRDIYGEDYALRGLSRRLTEVTLSTGFTAPQQPAHLTIRAALQDVSGQMGPLSFDPSRVLDLGFDAREIKDAGQQTPAALLDQLTQDGLRYGVKVRYGVGPDLFFFCRPAKTNVRNVTAEAPLIKWRPPVAETPCTAVLWFVGKYVNGIPITYLSESVPLSAAYGRRVKRLSIEAGWGVWKAAEFTAVYSDGGAPLPLPPEALPALTDGPSPRLGQAGVSSLKVELEATTDSAVVYLEQTMVQAVPYMELSALWYGGIPAENYVEVRRPGKPAERITAADLGAQEPARTSITIIKPSFPTRVIEDLPAGTVVHFHGQSDSATVAPGNPKVLLQIIEARPEAPSRALLDELAAYHYAAPAQEPADIETGVFVPPDQLPGRVLVYGAAGEETYERPLDMVEYRLTGSLRMAWLTEQAENPSDLAQASLIRKRDSEAVMTAYAAQT